MITIVDSYSINEYVGLSSDTKPTDDLVPNGSIFYELDTQKFYMYDKPAKLWRVQ